MWCKIRLRVVYFLCVGFGRRIFCWGVIMKYKRIEPDKVRYFTEIGIEPVSEEEKLRRRKIFLILDILDIINEKQNLSDEEILNRVLNAVNIFLI